ncbi:MAG: hypothetical protein JZU45_03575 [Methyloversatilis discipulorum]|uniref:lipase family protein n=1 Tax=Methyloversatilis discipulorum TaxID=1119528 RepID=UPI0026EDE623|nr:hypothetical protein [Methyloversatilis discipulorum]MBV5285140.1 hypothetical protein [Methyloversatilis discipulorum]
MLNRTCAFLASLLAFGAGLSGCATFTQESHQVLVRDPRKGKYDEPADAEPHARMQWQYAAMSDYAYEAARLRSMADRQVSTDAAESDKVAACGTMNNPPMPSGWTAWADFPSETLTRAMRKKGLYLLVLEREASPREIVVVFEGTNFLEIPDWTANLRWFLRFIPGHEDQYTFTARQVAEEFHERLRSNPQTYMLTADSDVLRHPNGDTIRIVSTGHSLGGGLAQHFAYTFKQDPSHARGPRVSEVFAFDPSPVTGWYSSPDPPRTHNANGLRINRVFEHGEVLAYIRLFTSRLAPYTEHPSVWEYRYNFDPKANIIRNHSMRSLACGLYRAAHDSKDTAAAQQP